MRVVLIATLLSLYGLPAGALAQESAFLRSLGGDWSGTGMVLTKIGGMNFNVSCTLRSDASQSALSMNGKCRGLAVFTRTFSADVKASGQHYSGNYIGPSGQSSKLVGRRQGDRLNLNITWARVVNGDRKATLLIEKIGQDRLRLQTVDNDLLSGRSVVTSRIDLQRPAAAKN
ncbi:hypothetical protein HJB51_25210 [Rhizobium lentis]|uniref:hypothetical protein n=1 Tax=Rhizobium lentis TaxID=1138194 RepID=UPI001C8300AA|nr:hypothetical protein [Rhizobium lentis]MBX5038993.1 hypothetical protein [Rhizobium lentis]MBX5056334.1 hypothetical protein [Rhizobium lentis]MBX5069847.1 hypothetical protein [Rhizobium lentis]MBX5111250.1 hypothetical protein [Rhizobium lentis]MBX5114461.1 hypothetical protein [Rhizobium lentis]